LPKSVPADDRAELIRALETSARVETSAARKMDFDAAQTLFVIAATVQTIDILWRWFQAARAKNCLWDVVITEPNGDQVHLQDVTLDELRKIFDS
jgi:hypothetical protein